MIHKMKMCFGDLNMIRFQSLIYPFLIIFPLACSLKSQPLPPIPKSIPVHISMEGPVADPTIAIDSRGNVYAAWWGRAIGDIFLSFSKNGGETWSEARNISNTPLSSDFPALAVDRGDRVYLVWDDQSIIPLSGEVVFSISNDGSKTWSPPKNLSNTRLSSSRPIIVAGHRKDLYVSWIEEGSKVFFTRSPDSGETWSSPIDVSDGFSPNPVHSPAMTEDGKGNLYISWSERNGKPFLVISKDGGETWGKPKAITMVEPTNSPDLSASLDGTLFVVWSQKGGVYTDIYLTQSIDGGKTFSKPVNISQSEGVSSTHPKIRVSKNGNIFCVWHEVVSGNTEVFMVNSTDQGKTFPLPFNLSQLPGNSLVPRVVVNNRGNLFTVWEQGVKQAIFFSRF